MMIQLSAPSVSTLMRTVPPKLGLRSVHHGASTLLGGGTLGRFWLMKSMYAAAPPPTTTEPLLPTPTRVYVVPAYVNAGTLKFTIVSSPRAATNELGNPASGMY